MPVHRRIPQAWLKAAAHAGNVMKNTLWPPKGADLSNNIVEITTNPDSPAGLDGKAQKEASSGSGATPPFHVPGPREPLYMGMNLRTGYPWA